VHTYGNNPNFFAHYHCRAQSFGSTGSLRIGPSSIHPLMKFSGRGFYDVLHLLVAQVDDDRFVNNQRPGLPTYSGVEEDRQLRERGTGGNLYLGCRRAGFHARA